ncbi:MAG: glycosyltransferase family 39 protein, partial [Cytophagales bacterium]|nr:glycosyltransferase family 39 protein [Cytophagales bacterium]
MKKIIDNSWAVAAIVLGVAFALVMNNASLSFWDQDESSYAGFAYQMVKSGDFITPEFTWGEPHRKTPFHFWTIAASYQVFGVNEFAVRFPSMLAVLLTS